MWILLAHPLRNVAWTLTLKHANVCYHSVAEKKTTQDVSGTCLCFVSEQLCTVNVF